MDALEGHAVRSEIVSGGIDAAVRRALTLAQEAARDDGTAMTVGWWLWGGATQFMILPEDHELAACFAFTPIMRVLPDGMFVPLLRQSADLV